MSDLVLKNVSKIYQKDSYAVRDFNLEIKDRDFLILVGPSGCGKSTMLRMIAGLEEISGGELWIDGNLMNYTEPGERNLSMVFQNYALYPNMTVYDNMAFALKVQKLPKAQIKKKVHEAARLLEIEDLLKRYPKQLSGGQRQRVAIGSSIVRKPGVFLMDEPLSNLDAKLRAQMRVEISKLHKRLGTTIVYVTHDQTEAMTLGTRVVVMKAGMIQQADIPEELYKNPVNKFVAGFIGSPAMNFCKSELFADEKGISIELEGKRISLPDGLCCRLKSKSYAEKSVYVGIRPEDIYSQRQREERPDADCSQAIEAVVTARELLGSEVILHFQVNGEGFCARVETDYPAVSGDRITLYFDRSRLLLFDEKTEENLCLNVGGNRE